jgi:arylsulfatase A-like enzyme
MQEPVHVQQQLTNPEQPNGGIPRNMTVIGEKMREGGYATHIVGKWDAGMATPTHTPEVQTRYFRTHRPALVILSVQTLHARPYAFAPYSYT